MIPSFSNSLSRIIATHLLSGYRKSAGGVSNPLCTIRVRQPARDLAQNFLKRFGRGIPFYQCGIECIPQNLTDSLMLASRPSKL
jgi:hypothetical protein